MLLLLPVAGLPPVTDLVVRLGTLALLGSGSAVGTLAVARRVEDRELLAASEEVASIGLSAEEVERLLGEGT